MQQYDVPLASLDGFNAAVEMATQFGGKLDSSEGSFRPVPEGHPLREYGEHRFFILIPEGSVQSFDTFLALIGATEHLMKVETVSKAA